MLERLLARTAEGLVVRGKSPVRCGAIPQYASKPKLAAMRNTAMSVLRFSEIPLSQKQHIFSLQNLNSQLKTK